MHKINKKAIESIKVVGKWHNWHLGYYPQKKANWFYGAKPSRWGDEYSTNTEAELLKNNHIVINNKAYLMPRVKIKMTSGVKIVKYFSTYKKAEEFAHNYIKENDIKDLINSI